MLVVPPVTLVVAKPVERGRNCCINAEMARDILFLGCLNPGDSAWDSQNQGRAFLRNPMMTVPNLA